jgi:hypothetical protein
LARRRRELGLPPGDARQHVLQALSLSLDDLYDGRRVLLALMDQVRHDRLASFVRQDHGESLLC